MSPSYVVRASDFVVKDNALIRSSYTLSLVEQRLVLLAVIGARESGRGVSLDSLLCVSAANYSELFGVTKEAAYSALKDAVDSLFLRQFSYTDIHTTKKPMLVRSRWVSKVVYVPDSAIVEICFSPDVVPMVTRLSDNFTKYALNNVASLTSAYAVRLYELLVQWVATGFVLFSLDDLREKMGLSAADYPLLHNFKTRVLDFALKQINDKTDLKISYIQHKTGRTITGFTFEIQQKKPKKETKKTVSKKETQQSLVLPVDPITEQKQIFGAAVGSYFLACDDKKQALILDMLQGSFKGKALSELKIELSVFHQTKNNQLFIKYGQDFDKIFKTFSNFSDYSTK